MNEMDIQQQLSSSSFIYMSQIRQLWWTRTLLGHSPFGPPPTQHFALIALSAKQTPFSRAIHFSACVFLENVW